MFLSLLIISSVFYIAVGDTTCKSSNITCTVDCTSLADWTEDTTAGGVIQIYSGRIRLRGEYNNGDGMFEKPKIYQSVDVSSYTAVSHVASHVAVSASIDSLENDEYAKFSWECEDTGSNSRGDMYYNRSSSRGYIYIFYPGACKKILMTFSGYFSAHKDYAFLDSIVINKLSIHDYNGYTNYDLTVGDKILIKYYQGGYLMDDGDGTLSTQPIYDSESQLWEVGSPFKADRYKVGKPFSLKNVGTDNYLKHTCVASTVTGSGTRANWILGDVIYDHSNSFEYQRAYSYLSSAYADCCPVTCCTVTSTSDNSITQDTCDSLDQSVTIEIIVPSTQGSTFISPQLVLLNALVSVVTCLFTLSIILSVYYCVRKCQYKNSKQYEFVANEEEENINV